MEIDLNCDLGEGCAWDGELMPLITSANVSCGFHAGDAQSAYRALGLARDHGVAAGAHPGFADRAHFGRRELDLPPEEILLLCLYQVGALQGLARRAGTTLKFLKPHGALYNMACREEKIAVPVVEAARTLGLAVVGLPGSALERACQENCSFIPEGFADRRYLADGRLVPRTQQNAFVEDVTQAAQQAEWLIRERGARTLCVHGDNPKAVEFVGFLRRVFQERGIQVRACL